MRFPTIVNKLSRKKQAVVATAIAILAVMTVLIVKHFQSDGTVATGNADASSIVSTNTTTANAQAAAGSSESPDQQPGVQTPSASGTTVNEPSYVRTASIALNAHNVNQAADAAISLVTAMGGQVNGDNRSDGDTAIAQLVLLVPAQHLGSALTSLDHVGQETSRTMSAQDVSANKEDLDARIAESQASVGRLQTLMSTSGSLSDLLAIESQLTQRQSDLESMQAQQRGLDAQIALAAINLTITAPGVVSVHKHGPHGFGSALRQGWHGLVLALRWIAAVLGYVLPGAVALTVLIALAYLTRTYLTRRHMPGSVHRVSPSSLGPLREQITSQRCPALPGVGKGRTPGDRSCR